MLYQYSALIRSRWQSVTLLWIIISIVVLGFIQPGYNHLRDTVSILAVGKFGWIQDFNFLLCMIILWSLANQYPILSRHSFFVRRTLQLSGIAIGLLAFFPAQLADASIRNFHGWSNPQSFIHFFLVASVAVVLLPVFVTQCIRDTATQTTWQHFHRLLYFSAATSCAAIPLWLWLRISGIGYEYKGIIEKLALLFALYLVWQFQLHLLKTHQLTTKSGAI